MSYILHFLVLWTPNITLGLDPVTLSSQQRTDVSLNVILLPESFLKTFIDIMLGTLLFYVFAFLFFTCIICFIYSYFITRLATCNQVAVCQQIL